jgi:hypothetical protein
VSDSGKSIAAGAAQQAESLSTTFGACDMIGGEMESSSSSLTQSAELMADLGQRLRGSPGAEATGGESVQLAGRIQTCLSRVLDSSRDQARAMNAVTSSLSEIELVTNRAAREAGMGAAASEKMNSEAQSLIGIVDQLRSLVDRSSELAADSSEGQGPGGLAHLSRAVSKGAAVMESQPAAIGDRR